jgi:putative PIN family toxin of toxin-antitoxin system
LRVVIDTNVYISSLLFKGKAREAYDLVIANAELYISDFIVSELSDKLHSKFSVPSKTVREIIASILSVADNIPATTPLPKICRDADDNYILQFCDTIAADFLITGDKDLLILKSYKSTQIISPTDFMKLVV